MFHFTRSEGQISFRVLDRLVIPINTVKQTLLIQLNFFTYFVVSYVAVW